MKYILLLTIFTLTLISCDSTVETKKVENVSSPKIETGKKFFEYDEIVYYFNDYDESKLETSLRHQNLFFRQVYGDNYTTNIASC